jgi:tetrahydromethanopterin S-methyltransferase subunit G
METKDSTSRLDRIESKIDKLAETMISLARAEEKLIGLESDKTFMMERMLRNEERVDTIEKKVDESAVTVKVVNRVFWILVAVVASALVGQQFI